MKFIPVTLLFMIACTTPTIAEPVKLVGTIKETISLTPQPTNHSSAGKNTLALMKLNHAKTISFLKLSLSAEARQTLQNRTQLTLNHRNAVEAVKPNNRSKYPIRIQLGMSNVPVLSQGEHGSCVTFANTAAYDAAMNKGDYISQLCQLALTLYLEKYTYNYPNGWNGSSGARKILSELDAFGIINKTQEKIHGCGGLTQYPLSGAAPEALVNLEEYKELSEEASPTWSSILEPIEAFSDYIDSNKILMGVKESLVKGDRLTFGTLLMGFNWGYAGALGTYHVSSDTWVLTSKIARSTYIEPYFAGHEMIITGYDDNAIAYDDEGYEHQGLLTLRNSWGEDSGYHGNFYMSYDYFKLFVLEVHRIRAENENQLS